MSEFYGTRQVAKMLGLRPDALTRHIWNGTVNPPAKSPGGDYLWDLKSINSCSWALLHREYKPQGENQ
jgi:hypothetical protein